MSSYLNNLLTNTTSRYNNLRRQLLSDEADGETEDDSHISRVLRAYYTEQGRPFPQWLPPDPKNAQPAPAQFASSAGRQQNQVPPMSRAGGGLSDLWDQPSQQQQAQQPLSLRRTAGRGPVPPHPHQRPGHSMTPEPQSQGRPLPSQRAGSYQSTFSAGGLQQSDASPPPSAGSGSSAQERLKARLWGRSNSPAQTISPAEPPASPASTLRGSYERSGAQGRAPYLDERNNSHPGTESRQQGSFAMSANSPWSGNDDPYAPQGGGYSGQSQRGQQGGRVGLPSGPRLR